MLIAIFSLALTLANVQASPIALGKLSNSMQRQCRFEFDRFPILREMIVLGDKWDQRSTLSSG